MTAINNFVSDNTINNFAEAIARHHTTRLLSDFIYEIIPSYFKQVKLTLIVEYINDIYMYINSIHINVKGADTYINAKLSLINDIGSYAAQLTKDDNVTITITYVNKDDVTIESKCHYKKIGYHSYHEENEDDE